MPPLDPIPEFDLYAELNVAPFADTDAIERAWRAGVRSVHPDRARTSHQHIFTQHWERKGRVDSVTEGVENRGDINVEISAVTPHISSWHHDQLGKSAKLPSM